jgi:hypothetical protein
MGKKTITFPSIKNPYGFECLKKGILWAECSTPAGVVENNRIVFTNVRCRWHQAIFSVQKILWRKTRTKITLSNSYRIIIIIIIIKKATIYFLRK